MRRPIGTSPDHRDEICLEEEHPLARRVAVVRETGIGGLALPPIKAALTAGGNDPPDVVHSHFGPHSWRWLRMVGRSGPPIVVSFYGYDATMSKFREKPWIKRYRELFESVSAVLVEGPAMAEQVVALGCDSERIRVVRLPFLDESTQSTMTGELPGETPKRWAAAMAGRLVPKKGFHIGIEAFALTCNKDHRLLVVGNGSELISLQRLAARLGLTDRVDFMPAQGVNELVELLRQCAVVIFPSVVAPDGNSEGGAPTTIPLVHSLGIPIVISDLDDLPFAAAPGTPVHASGDARALADALGAVWEGPDVESAALAAQEFVAMEYDPALLTRRREAVYDEVVRI